MAEDDNNSKETAARPNMTSVPSTDTTETCENQRKLKSTSEMPPTKAHWTALSHRHRRAMMDTDSFHSNFTSNDDGGMIEAVPDDFEVPGAHRIPGLVGGGGDDESHAVTREEPAEPEGAQDSGAPVVTAWVVEDVEEQRAEIPDAVVQNGPSDNNEDGDEGTRADLPQESLVVGWIRRRWMLMALIAVLVAPAVIASIVLLPSSPSNDELDDSFPSAPPSAEADYKVSRRFIEALQILENVPPGEEALYINNLTQHQYEALTWLADDDRRALDFQTVNPVYVIQRYALAAIYYSTQGWPLQRCLPFMSVDDVCDWKVALLDDCYINNDFEDGLVYFQDPVDIGVSCNNDGYVTSLVLGK
jgi:hypothetical protein